ncbi:MAG: hypothetical protein D3923_14705, partial [Candidatus Electrothrix sp. AR3]|nr:hypothetical protein [Candidatus Electrothrix sp. AR3]
MKKLICILGMLTLVILYMAPAYAHIDPDIVQKLLAPDGAVKDYFGYSVSVDGDTALIGAYGTNASFSGAAYVFARTETGW